MPDFEALVEGSPDLYTVFDEDGVVLYQNAALERLSGHAVEHGSTNPASQTQQDAVEHGGSGVTVTVDDLADGFFLEDDGCGIPADRREQVFEPGYSTASEGTGYRLGIVERIVDANGWSITVTEGSDGGARFEITGVEFVA